MEKLEEFINGFRVSKTTKEKLILLAQKDKRKLNEYIRVKLDELVSETESL